ncbi:hypothetical protein V1477_000942 [Vespula maculifrons]|uniref:Uncharacterized protein n=1 Tax=Vespula maculifrons TaxID=7453 RepID=A0ABD2D1P3_VESMC
MKKFGYLFLPFSESSLIRHRSGLELSKAITFKQRDVGVIVCPFLRLINGEHAVASRSTRQTQSAIFLYAYHTFSPCIPDGKREEDEDEDEDEVEEENEAKVKAKAKAKAKAKDEEEEEREGNEKSQGKE